tara:strand:- start:207 stop:569 length:363 start_codon:yes stop_codon:yes gene_type:complete
MLKTHEKKLRRHKRIRAKIQGSDQVPRLCVSRTSRHIYAQIIDDKVGKTILSVDDSKISKKTKTDDLSAKVAIAYQVGQEIGKQALAKKIEKVVFDRGGYRYHGRIKAVAEGARKAGLKF